MTVARKRQTTQGKTETRPRAALDKTETETGRLQSFSDGVFAVAITLLVLTLVVPELQGDSSTWTPEALARELTKEWPSYLALVTSFGTILIMWVNHHTIVKLVRRA